MFILFEEIILNINKKFKNVAFFISYELVVLMIS